MEQQNKKATTPPIRVKKECPINDPDYILIRELVSVCNYAQLSEKTGLHRNTLSRMARGFPVRYSVLDRLIEFFRTGESQCQSASNAST